MQRKELEKIPFTGRKKGKKYYLQARAFDTSDGTETMVVDAYDEKAAIRRYCYDGENYATYMPKEKKWTKRKIVGNDGYWENVEFCDIYRRKYREQTSVAKDTDETIREFAGKTETRDTLDMLLDIQKAIDNAKENKARGRRADKSREASEEMPGIGKAFRKFAMETMGENSFYYMQQGDDIFLTCSKCGRRDHIKGTTLPYSQKRECYFCGCEVARIRREEEDTDSEVTEIFSDIRPYKGGVAVIQVDVTKRIHVAKPEEWEFKEVGAAVFFKNRKTQDIYWRENDTWQKKARKERQGSYGYYGPYRTVIPKSGWAPDYAKDILKVAGFRTGYECYNRQLYDYLRAWVEHPEIEYLAKIGMSEMVNATIKNRYATKDLNLGGATFSEIFGVRPDRKKFLMREEGNMYIWSLLRAEHKRKANWGEDTIKFFRKNVEPYNEDRLLEVLKIKAMTAEKLKNYLRKQIKHFRTINTTLQEYHDYLKVTENLGYNLTDPVILFPKNLQEKHNERMIEKDREKNEKRAHEYDTKFQNVRKNYKKLKKRFGYRTDAFTIRPAGSCAEIVNEGCVLHHCVGASETYCRAHNEGRSFILFMRRNEAPEQPWCTIEIGKDGEIRQWFEAYDKKPDKDIIQPVLDEYVKQLAK